MLIADLPRSARWKQVSLYQQRDSRMGRSWSGQDFGRRRPAMDLQESLASVPDPFSRLEPAELLIYAQLQPDGLANRNIGLSERRSASAGGAAGWGRLSLSQPDRVQGEAAEDLRECEAM